MSITVDIRPEVEVELIRQAAARGRALEVHAASLLEEAVHLQEEPASVCKGQASNGSGAGVVGLLPGEESRVAQVANLMDLFEPIRGLPTDEEIDTLFSRNPSFSRPVNLG